MGRRRAPCRTCPFFKDGWCSHLAKRVSAEQPVCDFGNEAKHRAAAREYMARKRKGELRDEH